MDRKRTTESVRFRKLERNTEKDCNELYSVPRWLKWESLSNKKTFFLVGAKRRTNAGD